MKINEHGAGPIAAKREHASANDATASLAQPIPCPTGRFTSTAAVDGGG